MASGAPSQSNEQTSIPTGISTSSATNKPLNKPPGRSSSYHHRNKSTTNSPQLTPPKIRFIDPIITPTDNASITFNIDCASTSMNMRSKPSRRNKSVDHSSGLAKKKLDCQLSELAHKEHEMLKMSDSIADTLSFVDSPINQSNLVDSPINQQIPQVMNMDMYSATASPISASERSISQSHNLSTNSSSTGSPLAPSATIHHTSSSPSTQLNAPRVYIGNLAFSVSWQDLKTFIRTHVTPVYDNGQPESNKKLLNFYVEILCYQNGKSKGCAIVEFESIRQSERAIAQLNNRVLQGRKIFVREDRENKGFGSQSMVGQSLHHGNYHMYPPHNANVHAINQSMHQSIYPYSMYHNNMPQIRSVSQPHNQSLHQQYHLSQNYGSSFAQSMNQSINESVGQPERGDRPPLIAPLSFQMMSADPLYRSTSDYSQSANQQPINQQPMQYQHMQHAHNQLIQPTFQRSVSHPVGFSHVFHPQHPCMWQMDQAIDQSVSSPHIQPVSHEMQAPHFIDPSIDPAINLSTYQHNPNYNQPQYSPLHQPLHPTNYPFDLYLRDYQPANQSNEQSMNPYSPAFAMYARQHAIQQSMSQSLNPQMFPFPAHTMSASADQSINQLGLQPNTVNPAAFDPALLFALPPHFATWAENLNTSQSINQAINQLIDQQSGRVNASDKASETSDDTTSTQSFSQLDDAPITIPTNQSINQSN